jgi:succinate dehydrogenase / fumarate reductase iron-sulfur subunit
VKFTLRIWRQPGPDASGHLVPYAVDDVTPDMSFLEMLDMLNQDLIARGGAPVAFDHDCREGICGSCGVVINGRALGPQPTTTCQLYMRTFSDGDVIDIEPWRAKAFPVIRDLVVNRSAFDRIIQSGGYVTAPAGSAPEANSTPVSKRQADLAFLNATCIGCGACVAACPNGSAMLFTAAKVAHLNVLPQGQPERESRVRRMVETMDAESFGGCTNTGECAVACPQGIPLGTIANLNREYLRSERRAGRA